MSDFIASGGAGRIVRPVLYAIGAILVALVVIPAAIATPPALYLFALAAALPKGDGRWSGPRTPCRTSAPSREIAIRP